VPNVRDEVVHFELFNLIFYFLLFFRFVFNCRLLKFFFSPQKLTSFPILALLLNPQILFEFFDAPVQLVLIL